MKDFWPIFLPFGSPIIRSTRSCGGGFRWCFPGASTGPRGGRGAFGAVCVGSATGFPLLARPDRFFCPALRAGMSPLILTPAD